MRAATFFPSVGRLERLLLFKVLLAADLERLEVQKLWKSAGLGEYRRVGVVFLQHIGCVDDASV